MSEFTISQGLRRIKKLKGRMAELSQRAATSVSYDVKKAPAFRFNDVCQQIAGVREELVTLEGAVAAANATNTVAFDGRDVTLAEAIRRLQECKAEISFVSGLRLREGVVEEGVDYVYDEHLSRHAQRPKEVTYQTDLKEPERVAQIEALRERFDRLNDAVETANHRTTIAWSPPATPKAPEATETAS